MSKEKKKKKEQYPADNEIIIGVTTKSKPKEKVRVNKKTTRTSSPSLSKGKSTKKNTVPKKSSKKSNPNKIKQKAKVQNEKLKTEEVIKKNNHKKAIISIILLFFLALGGTIYYLTTPIFNVSYIEIYGNEKNSVETYISLSKINIGSTNLFAFTQQGIQKNIKENPYVEEVMVKRKLPNTVQLYITERKVAYQIEYGGRYIYLDPQGYLLEINEEKKEVPWIRGFTSMQESIQIGQRLQTEDLVKLNVLSKIVNYCKYNTIENEITGFDVTDSSDYKMYFEKDKKIVYLGDASNLSERLSLLKTILKNEKGNKGEIFMNGDLKNDKVFFRKAVEEKSK